MRQVVIEAVKPGEFVKRKPDARTVFKRGHFDRATMSYALVDCEDINREVFIKRGTLVYIDFTY